MHSGIKVQAQSPKQKSLALSTKKQSCPLCKSVGCTNVSHFLSACRFLPESDPLYMSCAQLILGEFYGDESGEEGTYDPHNVSRISLGCEPSKAPSESDCSYTMTMHRVQTKQSSYMDTFFRECPLRISTDSCAETNTCSQINWCQNHQVHSDCHASTVEHPTQSSL